MEPFDLTVEILKDIRDGVRTTNTRIDETNTRLDAGLAGLREQQVHTEIRLATELVAVSSALRNVTDLLRVQDGALRARVEDHERRLDVLEKKTG
jgi:hypothetical protein